jgi:hypothetical protein
MFGGGSKTTTGKIRGPHSARVQELLGSGRGDGGLSEANPLFSKYKKKSAAQIFIDKKKGVDEAKLTSQEKYQRILDKKINELKISALSRGSRFSMTGEQEDKPVSRGMEMFIQKQAEKLAKAEYKKLQEQTMMKIKPVSFATGGGINKKGIITGKDGRMIATINPKTGQIKGTDGSNLGKYKSGGGYTSENKIVNYILKKAQHDAPPPTDSLW